MAKLHRASVRRSEGRFLAEGFNSVDAALSTGRAEQVLVRDDDADRHADLIGRALDAGIPVHRVTARAADKLSETSTAPGVFAVCQLLTVGLAAVLGDDPRLLVIAVEPREPGNLGTLTRCADAMGADAVILLGDSVDPHNGKSVRASAGSVFHIPVVRTVDVAGGLAAVADAGIVTLATTMDGELSLDDADDVLARPHAWLFGNEAHGLPQQVLDGADRSVRIPLRGRAESLNLAAASAVCLYASARVQNR
ncbi:tRNA/rRNA methyltransferase SpoU [Gordonia neofelifaecis NRRL B-59395]|uniref:tRNA/rRNA methyltransferase SpoU n=1 Tax=Gordonia neofelifaecis NRRL B-59395 TaxID=644548 RepID=F1YH87_9ACTN|nr:RNA methyltransferase [Gordonia neofelifaecis]EGD56002.1 tRNA/rRNA methyltransferase SpoU [Gordonia neofelifaecis NRRL B-59395]